MNKIHYIIPCILFLTSCVKKSEYESLQNTLNDELVRKENLITENNELKGRIEDLENELENSRNKINNLEYKNSSNYDRNLEGVDTKFYTEDNVKNSIRSYYSFHHDDVEIEDFNIVREGNSIFYVDVKHRRGNWSSTNVTSYKIYYYPNNTYRLVFKSGVLL